MKENENCAPKDKISWKKQTFELYSQPMWGWLEWLLWVLTHWDWE